MAAKKTSSAKKPKGLVPTARKAVRQAERRAVATAVNAVSRVPSLGDLPSGEAFLAKQASAGSSRFMPKAEVRMNRTKRPSTGRLPLLIMQNAISGEVSLADAADQQGAAHPNFLERVASRTAGEGDLQTAIRLRRRALELDPKNPARYLALANTLGAVSEQGVVHDWIVGLAKGPVAANGQEVLDLLKQAHELAPGNPYMLHEYGTALIDSGQVHEGVPLLEAAVLKQPGETWFMELADIYRRPDVAQFEKAMAFYERVFEKNPKNTKALAGIINAGTRGPMDWARIWGSVHKLETRKKTTATPYRNEDVRDHLDQLFWTQENPTEEQVETLVAGLKSEANRGSTLHPMALNLVITRLQFARFFSAGFDLREAAARGRTRTLRNSAITTAHQLRNLMKAHTYLEDAESVASLADPRFWDSSDQMEHLQLEKLQADAELMSGRPEAYIEYSRKARKRTPLAADDTMEKLVKGRRVALVGPAETGDRLGNIIDEYDVVVRPRYQPEFIAENRDAQGSRTDITYYSGQDLTNLFETISGAAEAGDIKVVNARPFSHAAHAHRNLDWLRFYRQDFSLCFHGGSLGIQRMAYDLLQFQPEEICVFNSDLYTGNSMFTTGWREGNTFGPYSHINDIVVSHDVKSEFRFMKALMATGVVTAQGRAAEVLEQTPDEYVRAVEDAGVLC